MSIMTDKERKIVLKRLHKAEEMIDAEWKKQAENMEHDNYYVKKHPSLKGKAWGGFLYNDRKLKEYIRIYQACLGTEFFSDDTCNSDIANDFKRCGFIVDTIGGSVFRVRLFEKGLEKRMMAEYFGE